MFRNTLTANDNYPVEDCGNLLSPIQKELSLKQNFFLISLFDFWNLHQILKNLKKKDDRHSIFISEITDCERLA